MIKKILLLLWVSTVGFAQEIDHNHVNWFAYIGQYNVSKKWGYHIEAQFRLDGELNRSNQNLFRLGGYYNWNNKVTLTAGYGLINTLSPQLNDYFNEDRIWEQVQINQKWNDQKNFFINRFRLEQRFVDKIGVVDGSIEKTATNFQNRLRYLNRNLFHVTDFKSGNEELYIVLQDEVFMNLGENNVNSKFFDQNRFLVGFGIHYKKSIRFEVAYMNQWINPQAGNDVMNHAVSLTLFQNLILYKE